MPLLHILILFHNNKQFICSSTRVFYEIKSPKHLQLSKIILVTILQFNLLITMSDTTIFPAVYLVALLFVFITIQIYITNLQQKSDNNYVIFKRKLFLAFAYIVNMITYLTIAELKKSYLELYIKNIEKRHLSFITYWMQFQRSQMHEMTSLP